MFYLETSAFLKLLIDEAHSKAMRQWYTSGHVCWSSQLLVTEAMRAGRRAELEPDTVEQALETVSLVLPGATTFRTAGTLIPSRLRSLDALHLASSLELGDGLEGVVTYDARLIEGVRIAGLTPVMPEDAS